jgi:hypothetical protein
MASRKKKARLTGDEVMDISQRLKTHAELTQRAVGMITRCQQLLDAGNAGAARRLFEELEALQERLKSLESPIRR